MIRPTQTVAIALAFVLFGAFAHAANPCGFKDNGKQAFVCRGKEVCLATAARPRTALCSTLSSRPSLEICPKLLAPVCCRKTVGRLGTITVTRTNPCLCRRVSGTVLFNDKCNKPPMKLAACPRILDPVCCYIKKFDLTVTASNPCICSKQYGGVRARDEFCGLKTVEA